MTESEVLDRVRRFVLETYLYTRPDTILGGDDPLLARGIIDSLGVMELVGFVEQAFGVAVEAPDITEQHFGSLNGVARFVVSRRGGS